MGTGGADDGPMARLREICLSFPEVTERPSHGAPAFFVRRRPAFVQTWPDGHHTDDFAHLWCAAPPGVQDLLVEARPERIFRPPYVGSRGWIGVRLDGAVDWEEIDDLCEVAYRSVAPGKLVALLDAGPP